MIRLDYCHGEILVFNADDWVALRKTHRILGVLIGNDNFVDTLPLKLSPEETLLLLDAGIAKLVEKEFDITNEVKEKNKEFETELLAQQKIIHKNKRRRQLESMIDNIVIAKRKKGDNRPADEILNEELEKSCQVSKDTMIWPVLLTPTYPPSKCVEISRDVVLTKTSKLKYAIYKDLWEKGYYVSSGHKFGGDFLVYLGDPIAYHAIFIVHCVEDPEKSIHSSEIVAFGRLATAVKKRAVLASFDAGDHVSYVTINWIDA